VDRCASWACSDSHLAQHRQRSELAQRLFQRAQLRVDVPERRQLRQHHLIVALAEAVQVEHQSAEVAICELACSAQKARTPAQPSALAEAGGLRRLLLYRRRLLRGLFAWRPCRLLRGLFAR
jgi:hypothetical protein